MLQCAHVCAGLLLATALFLSAACSTHQTIDASLTPIDALRAMQQHELAGNFEALADAMTDHGFGLRAEETITMLLWGAVQPVDPAQGEPFKEVLESYDLITFNFWYAELVERRGLRNARIRLTRRLGEDRAPFLRDSFVAMPYLFFSGLDNPELVTADDEIAVVRVLDRNAYSPETPIELQFVFHGNAWLFDDVQRP